MQIFVGTRDVTNLYNAALDQGMRPEGNFSSKEKRAYITALGKVERALRETQPDKAAAISQRFAVYIRTVNNNCHKSDGALPVLQGMYEELTQFIESKSFTNMKPAVQQKIVGLQADLFSRLKQMNSYRGAKARNGKKTGSFLEPSKFNPRSEAFQAHRQVLTNVTRAASGLSFETQCRVNKDGDASVDDAQLNVYGPPNDDELENNPFGANGYSRKELESLKVNMDVRYPTHSLPEQPTPKVAERKINREALVNTKDALGGLKFD